MKLDCSLLGLRLFIPGNGSRKQNIFSLNYTHSSWIICFSYSLIPIFNVLMVLSSSQAAQKGLLTQQRGIRSDTGYCGFHLQPCSQERVCTACACHVLQPQPLGCFCRSMEHWTQPTWGGGWGLVFEMVGWKWAVETDVSSAKDLAV